MRAALSTFLGALAVALVADFLAAALLPAALARTAIPWAAGAAVGVVAAFGLLARRGHPWGRFLVPGAVSAMVGAAVVAVCVACFGARAVHASASWKWAGWVGGAMLLVWILAEVAEARGAPRRTGTSVLVGLLLGTLVLQHGGDLPATLKGENIRTWNLFHYYLGSKYFADIGYFGLYPSVLHGDALLPPAKKDFRHVEQLRDMHSYLVRARDVVLAANPPTASPERLRALATDARWLRARAGGKEATRVVMDLGYNPAPPWTFLWGSMARHIPLDSPARVLITGSDLVVHLLCLAVLFWGWGPRVAALAGVWIHAQPVNATLLLGGYLNYDWLLGVLGASAAWRRGRPGWSAFSLAIAAMTRGFPGLLALPLLARAAWGWVRRRPDPTRTRFALVFVAACAILFAVSHTTGRGWRTWPEWWEKISIHEGHHATSGDRRIGVEKMARHDIRPGRFFGQYDPERPRGKALVDRRVFWLRIVGFSVLGLTLYRRRDADTIPLMLLAVFLLATSSRYYASVWAALFGLGADGGGWARRVATLGLLLMIPGFSAFPAGKGEYVFLSELGFITMMGSCLVFLAEDLRGWWNARKVGLQPATGPVSAQLAPE
jgi:hypothetical protein